MASLGRPGGAGRLLGGGVYKNEAERSGLRRPQEREDRLNDATQEAAKEMVADFQAWLRTVKAVSHPIADDHGNRVLKAYFDGSHPFREPKARDDIPDSFIFEAIQDLSKDLGDLNVVTADGRLAAACRALPRVSVFTSLDSFIQDEICQDAIREHDVQVNLTTFAKLVNDRKDIVLIAISNDVVEQLAMKKIHSPSIPEDSKEALIMSVDEPFELTLDVSRVAYYGKGTLVIPITFLVEVNVEYYIYKVDYYCLPEARARAIHVSEYDNDHYFDASETLTLSVSGSLSVKIDPASLQPDREDEVDPENAIDGAEYRLDGIDSFEVEAVDENE